MPPGVENKDLLGNLSNHSVVEHEDRTITVTPSILITEGAKNERTRWHGFLKKGLWRIAVFIFAAIVIDSTAARTQTIPVAARQYERLLIGNARFVWGINAPIAVMAAQVHQESSWRADAKSAFASGLTQFTPATADWISQKYASELGDNQPLNPAWALRALARYDKHLYDRQAAARTDCDRWAFTLASYNGGEGWVTRDKRLAAMRGADPNRWWNHVERYSSRASWAFAENRQYPRRILLQRQPIYRVWGRGVEC